NNSPIQNNGSGIEIIRNSVSRQPILTHVGVQSNAGIGIQHVTDVANPATLALVNCQVNSNGGSALLSSDAGLTATNTVFDGNQRGLRLEKVAALDGQGTCILTGCAV